LQTKRKRKKDEKPTASSKRTRYGLFSVCEVHRNLEPRKQPLGTGTVLVGGRTFTFSHGFSSVQQRLLRKGMYIWHPGDRVRSKLEEGGMLVLEPEPRAAKVGVVRKIYNRQRRGGPRTICFSRLSCLVAFVTLLHFSLLFSHHDLLPIHSCPANYIPPH